MKRCECGHGFVYTPEESRLLALYNAGRYEFKPPPVYCGSWSTIDWVRYIDNGGGRWLEGGSK